MKKKRRNHSADFKVRVALDAIRGVMSVAELASKYKIHANQITTWKKRLLDEAPSLFSRRRRREEAEEEELKARLYQQIGQLQVEVDWLKKKTGWDA